MAFPTSVSVQVGIRGWWLNVRIAGVRRFRARVWLGAMLIHLAAWVMGVGCEIEMQKPED